VNTGGNGGNGSNSGYNAGSLGGSGNGLHSGGLSSTGATVGYLALIAGTLIAAGSATIITARRRKTAQN
ncbi:MAG: hypothetical protein J6M18_01320, partial [Actinomycetaceae bacterium]|nr:hypothetical protein [Actinomycetaceae bacterium]